MLKASSVFASPRYARTENLPLLAATLAICCLPQGTAGTEATGFTQRNGESEKKVVLRCSAPLRDIRWLRALRSRWLRNLRSLFSADTTRRGEIRHLAAARRETHRASRRYSDWSCRWMPS